jgi:hypothetical protein
MLRRGGLPVLAALLVAGCAVETAEFEGPIHERFRVPEKASSACLSAARLASKWCAPIEKESWADMTYGTRCNEARWDYYRYCR